MFGSILIPTAIDERRAEAVLRGCQQSTTWEDMQTAWGDSFSHLIRTYRLLFPAVIVAPVLWSWVWEATQMCFPLTMKREVSALGGFPAMLLKLASVFINLYINDQRNPGHRLEKDLPGHKKAGVPLVLEKAPEQNILVSIQKRFKFIFSEFIYKRPLVTVW